MEWMLDLSSWVGLLTLVVLEIVLGIDNLIFIAILVEKLPPVPECETVPPGPVVVPVTLPLPAVIDVDMPPAPGGVSPFLSWTTLQFLPLDDVLLLEPPPALAVELLELLVCADAAVMPTAVIAMNATSAFTGDLLSILGLSKEDCAARRPRSPSKIR